MTNQTVSETFPSLQELYGADFHLALAQTAATMANPAHGDRLRKAMDLVRRGAVTLHGNGTVESVEITVTREKKSLSLKATMPARNRGRSGRGGMTL